MQSWKPPTQMNDFVLAKSKVNNACQEINQKVYRLLLDALEATGPEKFLNAKFHFSFKQRPESQAVGFEVPDAGNEGSSSGLHPTFSGTVEVIPLGGDSVFQPQSCGNYDTGSENFGDLQASYSSQSSASSLVRANGAYIAPMKSDFIPETLASPTSSATLGGSPPMRIEASLKRSHKRAFGKYSKGKRPSGKYDPENHEIVRLRQEENLDFQEIADRLNEARSHNGGKGDLTDNAIYSRYTRNGPLIAQLKNEKFVPTAKDNQYTKMKFPRADPISGFNAEEDNLLELAEKQVEEQFWVLVSKRIEELGGSSHSPEMCERRFDSL